ncbi:rRNA maturation RNase YbeY [Desulfovibrio sulfodismutans]|uniref:Endoribonuclease YbeY n=1 Tax=Desulfolutivibrio sulfodismutans TaxID=63561 RepID=A0A7K3NQK2_9BACT|nr:rRNA maturation RNase YbeY [Desulfolutivibrio sulfodismutans]NDY58492.1 rRNA maturation RNase YbeY [Desulfolutivibrio sulfodismutans]QLA11096.1 rRNA maturation RNase YbeY [Desulfolutivibrio sulfodismutans DSM 3696]
MIEVSPGLRRVNMPISRRDLQILVDKTLEILGLPGKTLSLRVVADQEIEALNLAYLGLPGPTNVLSFPLDDPGQPDYLGDMAISVDTVAREAFLYGQPPRQHFIRMLCHGILHLAGFDHGPRMFDLTDQAVAAVAQS